MTDIYVVTEGEYSDYHIEAVYDNKAEAEYHAEHFGGEVETHELNPYRQVIADRLKPYEVEMLRNGDTVSVTRGCFVPSGNAGAFLRVPNAARDALMERNHQGALTVAETEKAMALLPVVLASIVLATDEQHAVKIVNEKRTRAIAEGRWPEDFTLARVGAGWGWHRIEG